MIMREIRLPVVETEIRIAKEMKAGNRSLYTVVRISFLKTGEGKVKGSWLTPLAMLIIEPGRQYAVSLTGERMSLDDILDLAPSLKAVVEKARGIRRIKVT